MRNFGHSAHLWGPVCALCVIGLVNTTARAAVIGTSAVVSTNVQELIDGFPGSVTSDASQTNSDLSNLPLLATGSLTSTDLFGELASKGQAFAEFMDPARLDQPNPEEFGLEVASYANGNAVAYSVSSEVKEWRTVIFTTAGNPIAEPEIEFGLFGTRTVESRVFISGAILFWSTEPNLDLTDMVSEVEISVAQDETGAILFSTSLALTGEANGGVVPVTDGAIQFEAVELAELAAEGVDAASLAVLEQVQSTGSLLVVVIPEQEHPYTYTVTANESQVLRADFAARVTNKPGGTGVAVVLGRPFENLAAFIDDALPGVDGVALQESVNAATTSRHVGLVEPTDGSGGGSNGFGCGVFGGETIALAGLFLFLGFTRPNRR